MSCKKYFVLAMLLLTVLKMGTALKCRHCYASHCTATTVECPTGQCYTLTITRSNDESEVYKGCNVAYCRDEATACQRLQLDTGQFFKTCHGSCCSTDFCNTAKEFMAVKAFICLMAIVGYFLA